MPAAPPQRFALEAATIKHLMASHAGPGRLEWIGLRPARELPMRVVQAVRVRAGHGLEGDRYAKDGKRQVTIIQAEHLPVVARLVRRTELEPALLRRNLVVSGISVLALKNQRFRIGEAVLEGTGPCEPCSRMESALGSGGYNAMRGHGGICACVLVEGDIALGDAVTIAAADQP